MITASDMGLRVALLCQQREMFPVMPFETYYAVILVELLSQALPSVVSITHSECEALSSAEIRVASFDKDVPVTIVVAEVSQLPKKHENRTELRQNLRVVFVLCSVTDDDVETAHRLRCYLCNHRA